MLWRSGWLRRGFKVSGWRGSLRGKKMARGVDAIPTARGVHVAHAHRLGIPARGLGNGHRWRPGLQISWLAVFVARFRGIVEGSCKPCESRDDVTGRLLMWRATAALLLAAATAADCPPPETVAARNGRDTGSEHCCGPMPVGRDSAPVKTDARGFFAKPSEPSTRPVRVVITPPSNKRNVDTITHFVPTIDPTDGASIDVVFTPRSAPPGFLLLRVVAVVVFAVVAFLIRRSARRRRRVSVLSESLVNNVDVEKAIANRRGMTSSRSLSGL